MCSGDKVEGATFLCKGSWYSDVVFSTPFKSPPEVIVSGYDFSSQAPCSGMVSDSNYIRVENISTTGFRVYAHGSPAGTAAAPCGGPNEGYSNPAIVGWSATGIQN